MLKNLIKYSFALLIMLTLVLLLNTLCYAEDDTTVNSTGQFPKNAGIIGAIADDANKFAGKTILSYDASTGVFTFNNAIYSELDYSEKKDFMEHTLSYIKSTTLGATVKNKVYNFVASQDESVSSAIMYLKSDTSADFIEARKWFAPFSGPISTFLGFMCIVILASLSMSVAFDIAYLVIPFVQTLLERGEEAKRPWGVSIEAWNTKKEMEMPGNEGKQTLKLYMKKRIPVFFCSALMISWLVSGKIYDSVYWVLNSFDF